MEPEKLIGIARKKPLSYDPSTKEFLYIDDVKAGRKVPLEDLDKEDLRKLVLKRLEIEKDFSIDFLRAKGSNEKLEGRFSPSALSKQRQMEEIGRGTQKGWDIVRAEINYLRDTIKKIEEGKLA